MSARGPAFLLVSLLGGLLGCTPTASPSPSPAATVSIPPSPSLPPSPPPSPPPPSGPLTAPPGLTATVTDSPRAQVVTVTPPGITFEIPNPSAGVSYTGAKLASIRTCRSEWDTEFAEVANAMLPFEALAAHVGSEPFCNGASFFDMHVRAYVLAAPRELVVKTIRERGAAEAARLGKGTRDLEPDGPPSKWDPRVDFPDFVHQRISYPRFYGDYGGTAHVDTFVRAFGASTLVLLVMWTKSPVYEADGVRMDPFASIVLSVKAK